MWWTHVRIRVQCRRLYEFSANSNDQKDYIFAKWSKVKRVKWKIRKFRNWSNRKSNYIKYRDLAIPLT